jgi:hypothetical protein
MQCTGTVWQADIGSLGIASDGSHVIGNVDIITNGFLEITERQ